MFQQLTNHFEFVSSSELCGDLQDIHELAHKKPEIQGLTHSKSSVSTHQSGYTYYIAERGQ